ncbi:unnamed protein product [Toxocara canis]|uniref:Ribophorin II C-terminal domain-containing protein n=1 Tax=Toxocara canis TaxID=6265 RepID=A0A3P7H4G2_TOXCA|nr:unnamed protein product [Toxocara canis]
MFEYKKNVSVAFNFHPWMENAIFSYADSAAIHLHIYLQLPYSFSSFLKNLFQWLRVGINFGNMPVSPWVIAFHAGLTGIFGLYFVFWLRLNMFETLKYLSGIGAFTFIAGNRLLRAIVTFWSVDKAERAFALKLNPHGKIRRR